MKVFHRKKRLAVGVLAASTLASVLGLAPAAHAATWNVKCDEDKLIQAITLANSNNQPDTINLAKNCKYEFEWVNNNTAGPNALPVIANDVGGHDLTINGHGAKLVRDDDGQDMRLLAIAGNATVIMKELTVTGGFLPGGGIVGGGGIALAPGSSLTGTSLKVVDNDVLLVGEVVPAGTNFGGGIDCFNCTLGLNKSTVADNDVTAISLVNGATTGLGGGIYSDGPALTLLHTSVKGNDAHARGVNQSLTQGGGINKGGGSLSITESTVTKNVAESRSNTAAVAQGGGVSASGATVTLTDSEISGNKASAEDATTQGGGLFLLGSATTMSEMKITKNTAAASGDDSASLSQGGGVYKSGGSLTVDSLADDDETSEINQNTASATGFPATAQGGGYYGDSATFNFTEFEKNKAKSDVVARGGGLYVSGGTVNLNQAEVTKNVADGGVIEEGGGIFGAAGSTVNTDFSQIDDNDPDDCAGTAAC